jgi:hypothetical protein
VLRKGRFLVPQAYAILTFKEFYDIMHALSVPALNRTYYVDVSL